MQQEAHRYRYLRLNIPDGHPRTQGHTYTQVTHVHTGNTRTAYGMTHGAM